MRIKSIVALGICTLGAGQASAAPVTFTGTVINLCVLTLSTPGLLGLSTAGTTLGSQETGGGSALLAIVAAGTAPTISFTAPLLQGPSGSTGGATTRLSYASAGGASQAYTTSSYNYGMSGLLDLVTINAQSQNPSGFLSGLYTISTTATCQQ